MKVRCLKCGNVFHEEDQYCPRCDEDQWARWNGDDRAWLKVWFVDGTIKTFQMSASHKIGGHLAAQMGRTGVLYAWNDLGSFAVPAHQVRHWHVYAEDPGDAA